MYLAGRLAFAERRRKRQADLRNAWVVPGTDLTRKARDDRNLAVDFVFVDPNLGNRVAVKDTRKTRRFRAFVTGRRSC